MHQVVYNIYMCGDVFGLFHEYKIYFLFFFYPDDNKTLIIKRVSIHTRDILARLNNKTSMDCREICLQYPQCSSYQYNKKAKLCDLSNATQVAPNLRPNDGNWDTYILKPGQ